MVVAGDPVIIDQTHEMFGGKHGIVQWVEHKARKSEYLVAINGTSTTFEFTADELLIP